LTFTAYDSLTKQPATISLDPANGTTADLNGLADQINKAGLGVVASVTTAAAAGGSGADIGIQISGNVSTTGTGDGTAGSSMGVDAHTALKLGAAGAVTDADNNTASESAMISYAAGNGSSDLTTYDLSSQSNAQHALTVLNSAITNVAAQDGYIGAQINTLNAVSSVLSTQQQNVIAAQNAVQATDYAQAASDISKYQILSQTGISALAQANSMQQEVTKLLQ